MSLRSTDVYQETKTRALVAVDAGFGLTRLINHDQDTEEGRWCPKCQADWRAGEIPRDSVAKGYYGHTAPCTKLREWDKGFDANHPCECPPRFYSRLIGIEIRGKYDGVSVWMCPHCGTRWNRWSGEELEPDE